MKVSDADKGEVVSVKLSESAAVKTVRFEGGSAEDWLRFFSNSLQIVKNKNLYEIATDEDELHDKKAAQALELSEKPDKTGQELNKNESKTLKGLIEEAKEHRKKEKEALDEVVNTIKVRLSESLGVDFDESFQTYLQEEARLEEGGIWVNKEEPRGHDTLTDIKFVISRFLVDKAGFQENTAEYLRAYIRQLSYDTRIEPNLFFERVEALNEMLSYSPTRKDKKGALDITPRGNIPFTNDKLMVMVIESFLPFGLWNHLTQEKGDNYYPASYSALKDDLKHVMQGYKWKLQMELSIPRKDNKPAGSAEVKKSADNSNKPNKKGMKK